MSLGTDSATAAEGLAKLGYGTDEIEEKQQAWLATCRELVKTMPGLSDIIDENTGEVKGGIPAIKAYADEWARAAKYEAEIQGIKEKKALYEGLPEESELAQAMRLKEATLIGYLTGYGRMTEEEARDITQKANEYAKLAYSGALSNPKGDFGVVDYKTLKENPAHMTLLYGVKDVEKAHDALSDYMLSVYDYEEFLEVQPAMEAALNNALEDTADRFEKSKEAVEADVDAMESAEKEMTKIEKAARHDADAMTEVETAVKNAQDAFTALGDHVKSVHDAVLASINDVAKGLNGVDYKTYGDLIEKRTKLITEQGKYKPDDAEYKRLQAEIDKINDSLIGTSNILTNLDQQAQFLDDYLANIKKAREMGLSDALLAELSDGSIESAQYLDAIVNGEGQDPETVKKIAQEIDNKYQEIQGKKEALAQELAGQQLTVDQVYEELAKKAAEAVAALDLGEEAKNNAADTIAGIAEGIGQEQGAVKDAVDGIISELSRLNGYGIDIDFGGFGNITFTTSAGKTEGSGRMGIPLVPHDDYIARLHEGERVLTAQENQIWNALRNGGVAGFDLETLGGVMRDNVKPGGNVYLDGRVVGSVISDQQGKSYRQLQRSGWQS